MRLFALSDLHLSSARPKPMEVFGPHWAGHAERIAAAWRAAVSEEDAILLPGDLSWAMKLDEARPDLDWLAALPGTKVLVKGNHDYWWSSVGKARDAAGPRARLLQNDAVRIGPWAIGGTRLWDFPEIRWPSPSDAPPAPECVGRGGPQENDPEAIRERELERLRLSLGKLDPAAPRRVALLHYPPCGAEGSPTRVTALLREAGVALCVYGHLHGPLSDPAAADRTVEGVRCVCVACDQVGFAPRLLETE